MCDPKFGIGRGKRICFPGSFPVEEKQIGLRSSSSAFEIEHTFPTSSDDTQFKDASLKSFVYLKQPVFVKQPANKSADQLEDVSHLLSKLNINGENGLKDFNVIAALEKYPDDKIGSDREEESSSEESLTPEQLEEKEEQIRELRSLRLVQSILRQVKNMNLVRQGLIVVDPEEQEEDTEDGSNVKLVWNKPYDTPNSVLKKSPNSGEEEVDRVEKQKKSVKLTPPSTHKSGFHPVRKIKGSVHYLTKIKRKFKDEIRRKSEEYLLKEVLAEKFVTDKTPEPINPLPYILNSPTAFVDFVVVQNNGPEEFFVRLGNLDLRRRFSYMEDEMKVWYSKKRSLMKEFAFTIKDLHYKDFCVYFHKELNEYVRCQVSEPVEVDEDDNPGLMVTLALIDYGGHEKVCVTKIRPLMPYFAQLPRMAIRGTLSLTKNLEAKTGREEYTEVEKEMFMNILWFHNGLVEALIAKEEGEDVYEDDHDVFPVLEMTLFVMENGKRKNIEEILIQSESVHAYYLADD